MKSSKATDVDPKQRSVYRCRHAAGAVPEVASTSSRPKGQTTSHPGAPGSKPKAVRKKVKPETSPDEATVPRPVGRPAKIRSSMGSTTFASPKTGSEAESSFHHSGDRALAPPFERSISLQSQIVPVLARMSQPPEAEHPSAAPRPYRYNEPYYHSTPYHHSSPYDSRSFQQFGDNYVPPPPRAPPAPKPPVALPEWTKLLTTLDPELAPLAEVMANPDFDVTPESFFAEQEDIQLAFLDTLDIPTWPKFKLKTKLKSRGLDVWNTILDGEPISEDVMMAEPVVVPSEPTSSTPLLSATPVPATPGQDQDQHQTSPKGS